MWSPLNTPIVALSSGEKDAAIGVIRISGLQNFETIKKYFSLNFETIQPQKAYLTELISGPEKLDEVILTFFKAPKSFTGENLLEIAVHGNLIHIENILHLFIENKVANAAVKGEFTYRALKNKKMTLNQAEGLGLFLSAKNFFQLQQGKENIFGKINEEFKILRQGFIEVQSKLELFFDFSEDIDEEAAQKSFLLSVKKLEKTLAGLFKKTQMSEGWEEFKTVLYGPVNAGKSTFFNFLLDSDRAIVSSKAGTTRDYIEGEFYLDGKKIKIIDTAGLRMAPESIEAEGIKKAREEINKSYFPILVVNSSCKKSFESLKSEDILKARAVIFTHSAQRNQSVTEELFKKFNPKIELFLEIDFEESSSSEKKIFLEQLTSFLTKEISHVLENLPISIPRQKETISKLWKEFSEFKKLISKERDFAVVQQSFMTMFFLSHELIGLVEVDESLNFIFDNFCIGK